jgi:hypothetical protein
MSLPIFVTVPVPVTVSDPQQKMYSPVNELNSNTRFGLVASCKQTSKTVTVNEQVAVLPDASVAVQVTVVVPAGKIDPEGGVHEVVTPGQLSEAVGGGNVTIAPVWLGAGVTVVTLSGQSIIGGSVSTTVIVNEQPGPAVDVQVTVVVPTSKNDPEAGEHMMSPQLPVTVGAG